MTKDLYIEVEKGHSREEFLKIVNARVEEDYLQLKRNIGMETNISHRLKEIIDRGNRLKFVYSRQAYKTNKNGTYRLLTSLP